METIKIFPKLLSSEVLKIIIFLPFINTIVLRWSVAPWYTLISIILELSKVPTRVLSFWSPVSEPTQELRSLSLIYFFGGMWLLFHCIFKISLFQTMLYSIHVSVPPHCSWNTSDYHYWIQCLDTTIYPGLLSIKGPLLTRLFLPLSPIILKSSVLLLEEYFGLVPKITSYPEKKLFL